MLVCVFFCFAPISLNLFHRFPYYFHYSNIFLFCSVKIIHYSCSFCLCVFSRALATFFKFTLF